QHSVTDRLLKVDAAAASRQSDASSTTFACTRLRRGRGSFVRAAV
ncbi:MAG: hypothetical protein QOF79_176, partial [Actinomycetota bacterium]|nr:hypothetical protein [Actinomycetota bacterium]